MIAPTRVRSTAEVSLLKLFSDELLDEAECAPVDDCECAPDDDCDDATDDLEWR
jgi:hypothetical protein